MIESCSQTGHCRRIASAQLAAQSVSSLCGGTESGIKRIVSIGARPRTLTCQDLRRKRSSFLPEDKIPTGDKENRLLPEIYPHCPAKYLRRNRQLLLKRQSSLGRIKENRILL